MAMRRTAYCRACGAEIFFIKTENGKTAPVDAEPVTFRPYDFGPEMFVMLDGSVRRGRRCDAMEGEETGYVSHFATCPNAEEFRRRGKKARKEAGGQ